MYLKRIFAALVVILAVAAMTANVNAQSSDAAASPKASTAATTQDILGSWEVTTTFPDGFRSKSIETFAPGPENAPDPENTLMGSVFSTADIDFTFPVPCANQQGVWQNSPNNTLNIHTTFKGFCYNTNFEPFGTLKIQQNVTLGPRGNGFTGRAHVELKRLDGSIEFSADTTVRAVRMVVEPLQ